MNLQNRIDAAIKRITSRGALMRIPVDDTDPDVVLADCKVALSEKEKECERLRDIIICLHNDIGIAHDVPHERLKDAGIKLPTVRFYWKALEGEKK